MPSPFPGMDPYLENPARWPDAHHELISQIRARLNSFLRPKYVALLEERVYVSDEDDPGRRAIIPDVRGWPNPNAAFARLAPPDNGKGQAAALDVAEPVEVTLLIDEEIRDTFIEIVDGDERRVVTVIEVVSPTNKVPGSRGQAAYQRKRGEVLRSAAHWLEIDLLRTGVPSATRERYPPCEYHVFLSRAGERRRNWVWPVRLRQRLPAVPVPLLPGDPDATLDLGSVFTAAYDVAGYADVLDYRRDPVPQLSAEDAAWADELLRARCLR